MISFEFITATSLTTAYTEFDIPNPTKTIRILLGKEKEIATWRYAELPSTITTTSKRNPDLRFLVRPASVAENSKLPMRNDIAKNVLYVYGVDRHDQPQWQAKLKRSHWPEVLCEQLQSDSEVGIVAYASSHHWGRELQKRGFVVKLIAAQFVKPYVKSNKNDRVDTEAICEAIGRPGELALLWS